MLATFTHSGGTITFTRAPQRPNNGLNCVQPQRSTAAGFRIGYDHTVVNKHLAPRLRMTDSQKDQLLNFFKVIVKGISEPFTYTDPVGTAFTVRFAVPSLDGLLEKAYDAWEITVPLRIIA